MMNEQKATGRSSGFFLGRVSIVIAAVSLIIARTNAQTTAPDVNGGPTGWDWEAAIIDIRVIPRPTVVLKLTTRIGGCVMGQALDHAAGDTVILDIVQKQAARYKVGQFIHVWINGVSASLVHPKC